MPSKRGAEKPVARLDPQAIAPRRRDGGAAKGPSSSASAAAPSVGSSGGSAAPSSRYDGPLLGVDPPVPESIAASPGRAAATKFDQREREALQGLVAFDKRAAIDALRSVSDSTFMEKWGAFALRCQLMKPNYGHLRRADEVTSVADIVRDTLQRVSRSSQHLTMLVRRLVQATRKIQAFVRHRLADLRKRKVRLGNMWKDAEADARSRIRGAIEALRERGRGNVASQRFADSLWTLYMDCWGHPSTIAEAVDRLWRERVAQFLAKFRIWRETRIRKRRAQLPNEATNARRIEEAKIGRKYPAPQFGFGSVTLDDIAIHIVMSQMNQPMPRPPKRRLLEGIGKTVGTGSSSGSSEVVAAAKRHPSAPVEAKAPTAPTGSRRPSVSSVRRTSVVSAGSSKRRASSDTAAPGATAADTGETAVDGVPQQQQAASTAGAKPSSLNAVHFSSDIAAAEQQGAGTTSAEAQAIAAAAQAAMPKECVAVSRIAPVSYYHSLILFDAEEPHFTIFLKRLCAGEIISYAESASRPVQKQLYAARKAYLRWEGDKVVGSTAAAQREAASRRNVIGPDGSPLARYMQDIKGLQASSPQKSVTAAINASPPKARSPPGHQGGGGRTPQRSPAARGGGGGHRIGGRPSANSGSDDDDADDPRGRRTSRRSPVATRRHSPRKPPLEHAPSAPAPSTPRQRIKLECPTVADVLAEHRRKRSIPKLKAAMSVIEAEAVELEREECEETWRKTFATLHGLSQEDAKKRRMQLECTSAKLARAAETRRWRHIAGESQKPVEVQVPACPSRRPSSARAPPRPTKQTSNAAAMILSGRGGAYVRSIAPKPAAKDELAAVSVRRLAADDHVRWTSVQ